MIWLKSTIGSQRVENESVSQFVGYDNAGAEVYDGDDLFDIAKFIQMLTAKD